MLHPRGAGQGHTGRQGALDRIDAVATSTSDAGFSKLVVVHPEKGTIPTKHL
jgi:hypothetical protein